MEYQKTEEATGDLIGKNIANKIAKVSKILPQNNNSETITNENNKEIPKEIYIYIYIYIYIHKYILYIYSEEIKKLLMM